MQYQKYHSSEILMIVDHKWFCIRCSKLWTLSVEMFDPVQRQKLTHYMECMTIHVLTNQNDKISHEIIHKEKIRGFNYKSY